MITESGTKGLLLWLKRRNPQLYAKVRERLPAQMAGMGIVISVDPVQTSTTAPPSSKLVDTINSVAQTLAQAYLTKEQIDAQKKILSLNISRAQQGLPPIDSNMPGYGLQPSIGVEIGDKTQELMKYAMYGLGAFLVLRLITARR